MKVVLLDVDPAFFGKDERYLKTAADILKKVGADWPNAVAPRGFDDVMHAFNLSGYGNILVDASGVVRGVNLHGKRLEQVVEKVVRSSRSNVIK